MKKKQKRNLVLVHSLPTNSIILKGLIDYLNEFFCVYFINLPGFVRDLDPLEDISLNNFTLYVEKKIDSLGLKTYTLGGISFGFWIVNNIRLKPECLAILAIEPYIGSKFMCAPYLIRRLCCYILSAVGIFNIHKLIWNLHTFEFLRGLGLVFRYQDWFLSCLANEMDPRTILELVRQIIINEDSVVYHPLPYVLLISDNDKTLNTKHIEQEFRRGVKDLLVVKTKVEHFPGILTKDYFKSVVSEKWINDIIEYVGGGGKWRRKGRKRRKDVSVL